MTAPETTAPATRRRPPKRGKKGGRIRKIDVRVDNVEYLAIDECARTAGLSRGSFLRAAALGSPGPRAKRRAPVDAEALGRAVAALNKVGSNLNQAVHVLNASGAIGMAQDFHHTLAVVREAAAAVREILGRKDRT